MTQTTTPRRPQARRPLKGRRKGFVKSWRELVWSIRHEPLARRRLRNGLLFTAPWIVGLLVLQTYPVLATLYYSFTDFDGLQFPPKWLGLQNYSRMLSDPYWHLAVRNTIWWVAITVPASLVIGLILAQLLNQKIRGLGLFRSIFYVPSMVPLAGAAIVFAWIFNPAGGPINQIFKAIGLNQQNWFLDPGLAKPTLLLLTLWQVGPTMIVLLAGLESVPGELYEASSLDGAGSWARFRQITLPLLTPAIFFTLILNLIWAVGIFTQAIFVSASTASIGSSNGAGAALGGAQNSMLFYGVYLYQVLFQNFEFGYGSAIATVLTVGTAVLTALLFRSARRWVFYYE